MQHNEPTWTEAEAKRLADFINFVHVNGEFPVCKKASESRKLTMMFNDMAAHLKKVESYVLEVKQVYDKDGKPTILKAE